MYARAADPLDYAKTAKRAPGSARRRRRTDGKTEPPPPLVGPGTGGAVEANGVLGILTMGGVGGLAADEAKAWALWQRAEGAGRRRARARVVGEGEKEGEREREREGEGGTDLGRQRSVS
jgi:hypothetical protein